VDKREIEIRQQIKSECISRPDRRALFRPAATFATFDINFLSRPRGEKILAELEVMKHGGILAEEAGNAIDRKILASTFLLLTMMRMSTSVASRTRQ
jgi:hypothetical protein